MIIDEAIRVFGKDHQIEKCLEEISEFQEALLKFKQGRDTKEHLAEELADARIMLMQIEKIFGIELETEFYQTKKLERLAKRIEESKRA